MNSTTAPDYVVIYVAAEETINTHVIYSHSNRVSLLYCILKPIAMCGNTKTGRRLVRKHSRMEIKDRIKFNLG